MSDESSSQRIFAALAASPAESGVIAVYLFGSFADGRMHRDSDVDVGVLLDRAVHPTPKRRFEARLRIMNELGARLGGRPVDIVILNDAPPGLGRRIVGSGRPAFCANREAEHAFRRDIQLRAADLEPFLRRMRRLKLDAMAR